ncbi:MAG: hypothetical protein F6K19_01400 [Cyanothece sp. SIO1E1]|nr:hypothetical protein [Cyanothece sp. SIO1E1]
MIVKDESLGNYEIHFDGSSYMVMEKTGRIDKKGKEVFKLHAYRSSMASALNKVVILTVEKKGVVHSLKSYLSELKEVSEKIKNTLSIDALP